MHMHIKNIKLTKTKLLLLIVIFGVALFILIHNISNAHIAREVKNEYQQINITATKVGESQKRVCSKIKFSTFCNAQYSTIYTSSGDVCKDYDLVSKAALDAGYVSTTNSSLKRSADISGFSSECEILIASSDKQSKLGNLYDGDLLKFNFQKSTPEADRNGYILWCQLGTNERPYGRNNGYNIAQSLEYEPAKVFGCTLTRDS